MDWFFFAALVSAGVGILPLLLQRRFSNAAWLGTIGFFVLWGSYYLAVPSTVWPLFGGVGACVVVMWIICAFVDGARADNVTWAAFFPVFGVLAFLVTSIYGHSAFNASTYASLLGDVEERNWTQDVQPKDPRHMRMVSEENAMYIAQKAVAQGGTMSQYALSSKRMTLQRVNGHLVYVVPFDFEGMLTWWNAAGAPGYIIVDAEDPERMPEYVELKKDLRMNYTPNAYFSYNLERYLRRNGFLNDGLVAFRFELDDERRPWWIVTTYDLSVSWFGKKVTGVAIVNPTTGAFTRYSADTVPEWVDRIVPDSFVHDYILWRGSYALGWLNSWVGKKDLTEPEDPILIYGSDDQAEWVTDVTSQNEKDDSLIGLMYTNSRTGKSVFYRVDGGGTNAAIIQAVNSNQQVKYKHLHATTPQIYNVYGSMAAVVPLLNDSHAYQGVAIVAVSNVQDIAVGETQAEALRNYQAILFRRGQQVALEKSTDFKRLVGVVDRIRQDVGQNGSVYFIHVAGVPRIFTASSQDHVKLPLTREGDEVVIEFVASGEETVPVRSFDNVSLSLDKTHMKEEVERAAKAKAVAEEDRRTTSDVLKRVKEMSPEELRRLKELLR